MATKEQLGVYGKSKEKKGIKVEERKSVSLGERNNEKGRYRHIQV